MYYEKNIRKLAAIMFTDMVGYTALMQEDENKAIKNREHHRKVMERSIQEHQGQILQYYGDGTLSVFASAVEAIGCAIEIQQELQKEPKVPLRIGMHVGDIVYTNDGVYGDAVNVASRIEKLSVAGGVLFSDKVYDEIKNHHEFSTSPLGEFKFKNVKSPVELYALTNEGLQVPTKRALKSSKWKQGEIESHDIQNNLLATKLYVPEPRRDLVQRERLIDLLNKDKNSKLTLISAPAGFGKTTLVSEWVSQSKIPVAWISLDKGDNDHIQFLNYLIAALQTFDKNIGESVLSFLKPPQQPPIESIMTTLIRDISDIPFDCLLVLDDYHLIDAKPVHTIVEFLLDHLPSHICLVITTRVDPPFPLARMRVRNQITELRAADLSFAHDETAIFFNEVMKLGLSNDDIEIFEMRTEGWVAGLQLAALSMQTSDDIRMFIKNFAGDDRHIVDYLAEEVLNRQPEHIRNFLLHTSILDRLTGSLCNAVTGQQNGQHILSELENANLFIIPLDNKRHWYRYHHLFTDLLRQQLSQMEGDIVPELHIRASKWYAKNKLEDEAVDHALVAQDFEQASYLIEELTEILWEPRVHSKLLRWFDLLPNEHIYRRPRLCIYHAWMLLVNGQEKGAKMSLQVVEKVLKHIADGDMPDDLEQNTHINIAELKSRTSLIRAMIAYREGDITKIIHFSHKALEYLPEDDQVWRGIAAIFSGDAHSLNGDAIAAEKAYSEALRVSEAAGNVFTILIANIKLAVVHWHQGNLHQSHEICHKMMTFVNESGLSQTAMEGWVHAQLGGILCEWNDIEDAYQHVCKGVELGEKGKELTILGWVYIVLARVLFVKKDFTAVKDTIQKLEELSKKSWLPPWITKPMVVWKVRLWLTLGNLSAAKKWAQEQQMDKDEGQLVVHELNNMLVARIYLVQDKCDEAVNLLDRLIKQAEDGGRITSVIEMLLIRTLVLKVQGNQNEALVTLGKALSLAKPGGFIRIFLDEGQPIAELLEEILETKVDVPRGHVKKLLSAFRSGQIIKTNEGLIVDRMSEREFEVLRSIEAGHSNKMITEELFISLSTVKTHIRNIFSKLDVHSRTEAIAKAKELDLL